MKKLDLKKIAKAREFLGSLESSLHQTKPIIQNDETKRRLHDVFGLAHEVSVELGKIGINKISQINEFLRSRGHYLTITPLAASQSAIDEMYLHSSTPPLPADYDAVQKATQILVTYETLAPWLEKVEEHRTIKGLAKILEQGEKK